MTKKKKVTISVLVPLAVAFVVTVAIFIRGRRASDYTVEEHVQRISEAVEKRYMRGSQPYTDFDVFPLYDENDRFANYCVVDFEPYGYLYVLIRDKTGIIPITHGMYSIAKDPHPWIRYRIITDENGLREDKVWKLGNFTSGGNSVLVETDKYGREKDNYDSHYKEAGIKDERRYLLKIYGSWNIPAVKRGDKYLNLISMLEFDLDPTLTVDNISCMSLSIPLEKKCDL